MSKHVENNNRRIKMFARKKEIKRHLFQLLLLFLFLSYSAMLNLNFNQVTLAITDEEGNDVQNFFFTPWLSSINYPMNVNLIFIGFDETQYNISRIQEHVDLLREKWIISNVIEDKLGFSTGFKIPLTLKIKNVSLSTSASIFNSMLNFSVVDSPPQFLQEYVKDVNTSRYFDARKVLSTLENATNKYSDFSDLLDNAINLFFLNTYTYKFYDFYYYYNITSRDVPTKYMISYLGKDQSMFIDLSSGPTYHVGNYTGEPLSASNVPPIWLYDIMDDPVNAFSEFIGKIIDMFLNTLFFTPLSWPLFPTKKITLFLDTVNYSSTLNVNQQQISELENQINELVPLVTVDIQTIDSGIDENLTGLLDEYFEVIPFTGGQELGITDLGEFSNNMSTLIDFSNYTPVEFPVFLFLLPEGHDFDMIVKTRHLEKFETFSQNDEYPLGWGYVDVSPEEVFGSSLEEVLLKSLSKMILNWLGLPDAITFFNLDKISNSYAKEVWWINDFQESIRSNEIPTLALSKFDALNSKINLLASGRYWITFLLNESSEILTAKGYSELPPNINETWIELQDVFSRSIDKIDNANFSGAVDEIILGTELAAEIKTNVFELELNNTDGKEGTLDILAISWGINSLQLGILFIISIGITMKRKQQK